MNSALDTFERSLVSASRALSSAAPQTSSHSAPAPRRIGTGRRLMRRLRSLGTVAQAGVALGLLSGCAGVAVAGYLLLAGSQARMLPEFECQIDGSSDAITQAVTGSPLVDCATIWPSATGGRESAPPLAVWGVRSGQRLVAIVRPARLGPPAGGSRHWARLPASWTVDLSIVALNDQLSNIDQPFTDLPQPICSYARNDVAAVRSLLRADGLSGWKVDVRGSNMPVSQGCRPMTPVVDGANRRVVLVQFSAPKDQRASRETQTIDRNVMHDYRQLLGLFTDVNRQLSTSCRSVPAAAGLWTRAAHAAGYTPTTLAWWKTLNAQSRDTGIIAKRYTLYLQPSSQRTGRCAHVLTMGAPGAGAPDVYVARIRP